MNQVPSFSRLKELRLRKGMTIADLADSVGVSRPTIWGWESGRSRPRRNSLAALAEALGVSEEDVIGDVELKREAISNERRQSPSEERPQTVSGGTLAEVIARSKDDIAHFAGTEPNKISIVVKI